MSLPRLEATYDLGDELGRGGFGVVLRATRRADGRAAAAKVLHQPPDPEQQARIAREAATLAGLAHPRLVAFQGVFQDEQRRLVLVYDEVPGEPLDQRLARALPSEAEALGFADDVAAALAALHAAGVVHRDLKPANLISGPDGHLTLLDFGLSRATERGATVTAAGLIFGTPAYMAPELFLGHPATPASDVYAFGCLLVALATGHPPFPGESPVELARAHRDALPPPLPAWAAASTAALAKDPSQRPSALDLAASLRHPTPDAAPTVETPRSGQMAATKIVAEPPDPATPTTISRTPYVAATLATLATLVLVLGLANATRAPAPAPPSPLPEVASLRPRELPEDGLPPMRFEGGSAWIKGTPSGPGIPFGKDRVAFYYRGCRILVADLASGTLALGKPLAGCKADRNFGLAIFPGTDPGELWALTHEDNKTLWLSRYTDPLSGNPDAREKIAARVTALYGTMQPRPGQVLALAIGYRAQDGTHPSTIWLGAPGAPPRPVATITPRGTPNPNGATAVPGTGWVMTVGERGVGEVVPRSLLRGIRDDAPAPWSFFVPQELDLQAPALAHADGVYLAGREHLYLLPRAGLHGVVPADALTQVSGPIPGLAHTEPHQLPGQLVAWSGGVDLLVSPEIDHAQAYAPTFRWLRFRAEAPGAPPTETTVELPGPSVVGDGSGAVRELTPTGSPDHVVVAVRRGFHHGDLAILDLSAQQPYRTFALTHEELTARAAGPPSWLPYRGGGLLLVPAVTETNRAFVFERFFAPGHGPTRAP